jgi:hypothetical protein
MRPENILTSAGMICATLEWYSAAFEASGALICPLARAKMCCNFIGKPSVALLPVFADVSCFSSFSDLQDSFVGQIKRRIDFMDQVAVIDGPRAGIEGSNLVNCFWPCGRQGGPGASGRAISG